ncbi:CocE/NonD family hydrolase [Adhaeribacter radiodurans]|uniref:CocE/NonD family hydrolase n=1 Tax=Adhaeribacter radiodurans TaxID=2745197 RepID=A0A7L7L8B0_9BACT|nr:CocE/NonD family hydrolase [Adhaeribacter radiodurans]QMU29060.1 CocE/NonD family hydrolase [Adhaeribacter radiodurans]
MIIRRLLPLLLFIFSIQSLSAQGTTPVKLTAQQKQDSLYLAEHYQFRKVMIPMRDGVKLYTELFIPKEAGKVQKYPFLMTRTPYNATRLHSRLYTNASFAKLAREGFILVEQDVRGRWHSEGTFSHERPLVNNADKKKQKQPDESTDTYDAIDWLLKNVKNNNGRVGIHGVSYPGFYSTAAAISNHPALKAVSPQAPVTDWFIGDDVHHKGAFFWMDFFDFLPRFDQHTPDKPATRTFGVTQSKNQDNYDYFLHTIQTPKRANTEFFKDSIPFWNDILAHPDYDNYWKSRNPLPHARNLKPAILTVGGWFDAEDLYGALKTYEQIEKQNPKTNNKLVMGPWCHGCWWQEAKSLGDISFGSATGAFYLDSLFLPFMNYHLKEQGSAPKLAEATAFEGGTNKWRTFNTWPPTATKEQVLYLLPQGKLGNTAPTGTNSFDEYVSDPAHPVPYQSRTHRKRTTDYMLDDQRFAASRSDVATFVSEPLTTDLTLAGPVLADLIASISTTDADFVVKIIDVYPEDTPDAVAAEGSRAIMGGYQQLVRAEIIRGRYRNSFEKPEAFVPNQPTPVRFTVPDLLHTFQPGHRLMVQIQSSWFPLADRNPQQFINIYEANPEDYIKSTVRLYHDAQHPSKLVVKVLPK